MSKKVSQMPSITSLADADLIMVVDDTDGANKRITKANALAGVGSPSLQLGAKLWGWNGQDLTQFGAQVTHDNDLGSQGGSAVFSVQPNAHLPAKNVIRAVASSLTGGIMLPVLTAEVTLPDRFVVVVEYSWTDAGSSGINGLSYIANLDTPGAMDGWSLSRGWAATNFTLTAIVADIWNGQENLASSGAMNAASAKRGGFRSVITVQKNQAGETPAMSILNHEDRNGGGGIAYGGGVPTDLSTVLTNWDGVDMDRFGVGIFAGGTASGTYEFGRFDLYAHPED